MAHIGSQSRIAEEGGVIGHYLRNREKDKLGVDLAVIARLVRCEHQISDGCGYSSRGIGITSRGRLE
jgi:hypothetical protein